MNGKESSPVSELVERLRSTVGYSPYIGYALVAEAADRLTALEAENARLRDRVNELEKALEPFAEYRHNIGYLQPDEFTITNAPIMAPFRDLTLGDLRTARRVREGGKF